MYILKEIDYYRKLFRGPPNLLEPAYNKLLFHLEQGLAPFKSDEEVVVVLYLLANWISQDE